MEFLYIEINLFSIIILILVRLQFKSSQGDAIVSDQKIFKMMIITNIAMLATDAAAMLLNGADFPGAHVICLVIWLVFYLLNPVLGYLYVLFCEARIQSVYGGSMKRRWIYTAGLILNSVFTVANIFTPVYFSISDNNEYSRGPLFFISIILGCWYIAVAFIIVLRCSANREDINEKRMLKPLLLFPIAPVIGELIQIIAVNSSVIWESTVISLLVIMFSIQREKIVTDTLTGLYNRRQLMPYLTWKIERFSREKRIYLIIADVDKFKQINDVYGHVTGDVVLTNIAKAVRKACGKGDFVGRYGGDEFIIVTERRGDYDVETLIKSIDDGIAAMNNDGTLKCPVSMSIGYAQWSDKYNNIDEFLSAADGRMYDKKENKKKLASKVIG